VASATYYAEVPAAMLLKVQAASFFSISLFFSDVRISSNFSITPEEIIKSTPLSSPEQIFPIVLKQGINREVSQVKYFVKNLKYITRIFSLPESN
jgi:hypothetical protein